MRVTRCAIDQDHRLDAGGSLARGDALNHQPDEILALLKGHGLLSLGYLPAEYLQAPWSFAACLLLLAPASYSKVLAPLVVPV